MGLRSLSFSILATAAAAVFAKSSSPAKPSPVPAVIAPSAELPVVRRPAPFPEEAQAELWDKGCEDWPVDLEHLKVASKKSGGDLRVFARLVLPTEKGETVPQALKSAAGILEDERSYPKWVMPGINDKPDGGHYFVTVERLVPDFDLINRHKMVTGAFQFKILWFKREGRTSLVFKEEFAPLPDCPAFAGLSPEQRKSSRRFLYRMIPREDLLQRLVGEIYVYPTGDHVEARLRVVARPSNIVYELLPESLFKSQLGTRGRRIWENFADFRRLDALSKLSTVAPAEPSQGEVPRSKGRSGS